jgi:site-specific recombinase XerD
MAIFKSGDVYGAHVWVNAVRVATKSGFRTKAAAKDWHDETKRLHKAGDPRVTQPKRSMDDLFNAFIEKHCAGISPQSARRYRSDIEHGLRPYFGRMQLSAVSAEAIETFKVTLAGRPPSGANQVLETLRTVIRKGVKWKWFAESPWDGVEFFKEPEQAFQWWQEREHIGRFLAVAEARSRFYPIYLTALETGMRYGEIVALRKEDIDFDAGRIHVQRQWVHTEKKYGPPKHGKNRFIDFDPNGRLAQVLKRSCLRSPSPELVFCSRNAKQLTYSSVAQKSFKSMQHKAGVPVISFHDMRHTFASWYMRTHDNIWDLKCILGHADIATTQRYAHHGSQQRRAPLGMAEMVSAKPAQQPTPQPPAPVVALPERVTQNSHSRGVLRLVKS